MKKIRLLIFLLPAICFFAAGCGENPVGDKIRFGTGGIGGKYYVYGSSLAQMIEENEKNFSFAVKTTSGSAANIRLLREGFLDFAIVQSDTLSDSVNGAGVFKNFDSSTGYAAVAGLYTEACQIIVPKNSPVETVNDLVGKKISVGEKESGVLQNAKEILLAHGLTFEMIVPYYLSFADSAAALESGEIDAFFCTAGVPTAAVSNLAAKCDIRFLPISPEILNNITNIYKGYTVCRIPAGTYRGQDAEILTLGVKAVLVANTELENNQVEFVTKFLFDNAKKIRVAADIDSDLTVNYAVTDIPCAFHAGTAKYYESQGVLVEVYSGAKGQRIIATQD